MRPNHLTPMFACLLPLGCGDLIAFDAATTSSSPTTSATCGNGLVEEGETCDGNCEKTCTDLDPCTTDQKIGSPDTCDVRCSFVPVEICQGQDACCPHGCSAATDSDCPGDCGDGIVSPDETCDPPESCPTACETVDSCEPATLTGHPQTCDAACTSTPISSCQDGDECCPPGCEDVDNDCRAPYPPPPYGTRTGDTITNFSTNEAFCNGSNPSGNQELRGEDFLGTPATLIILSTEWCGPCKNLASRLRRDYHDRYAAKGLKILYVACETSSGSSTAAPLHRFACRAKNDYGFPFTVAFDPGKRQFGRFVDFWPSLILLGPDMKIKFQMTRRTSESHLHAAINRLL